MTLSRRLLAPIFAAFLLFGVWGGFSALAALDGSCPGSVCDDTASVGGQDVDVWWTLNHNESSSSLKVRFRSGPYVADGDPVRFRVIVDAPFDTVQSLKNPSPSASLPPTQTINGPRTIVERSAASSANGVTYDFTQELRYGAPSAPVINVTLELIHYGALEVIGPFPVQVDPAAPSNRAESDSLVPIFGSGYRQCYDGIDNDLNYRVDCSDTDCDGESISPSSVCEASEQTCNDGLDNDGNGLVDCADPLCNGQPGNPAGTRFCGPENGAGGANCADAFDNDANGETDCSDDTGGTGCWRSGFEDCAAIENSCSDGIDNDRDQDYDEAVDAVAGTGIDCRDYDCAGNVNCPAGENLRWDAGSGTWVQEPAQCFNGLDDDLDGAFDCADDECIGVQSGPQRCAGFEAYLPPSPLGTGDPLPLFYFNYCGDGIDNDGDALADALDPDCRNVFGECGPSPATEDYTFLSCANAVDDDLNAQIDCSDAACRAGGKLGRRGCTTSLCGGQFEPLLTDAAACAAAEASAAYCGDGIDNDGDGATDCSDAGCIGQRHGPTVGGLPAPYFCGAESGAINCSDNHDNDSDLDTDCFDSACQDGVICRRRPATGGWTLAPVCVTVPHTTPLAPIVSGGFVQVAHDDRIHVNDPYRVRFAGAGSFTSLTLTLGDAINPANAFPFDASTTNCTLSGAGASQMAYVSSSPAVGAIFQNEGETLVDFDVTLTCASSSAVPMGPEEYNVSVVANHAGTVEFGEAMLSVQVYENDPPTLLVPAIDAEGAIAGTVNMPVGGSVRLQGIPADDPSGICRCNLDLDGAYAETPDGNCIATVGPFVNDDPGFQASAQAVDGADNRSATSTPQTFNINVMPSVEENLVLGVDVNGGTVLTYRADDVMNLAARFRTDTLSTFPFGGNCRVFVYDASWSGGQQAAPDLVPVPIGNTLGCQGTFEVPDLAPGRYWLFVEATDSSGDVVRSNAQAFLQCEMAELGAGACKDADFDNDGAPEGRFTPGAYPSPPTPTYPGPQPRACDNCVNFYNPTQRDNDANGIGDACEAGTVGRCQYKNCGSSVNDPTPGDFCGSDADCSSGDTCIVVNQLMCTINCAVNADCDNPATSVPGVCNVDWGVCAGPAADEGYCCFSDADCLSGECEALVAPFLETLDGQIYTGGELQSSEEPPGYNASFCLQASGQITNFTSAVGCRLPEGPAFRLPTENPDNMGTLGRLDVEGILNGKYGPLATGGTLQNQLDGRIYHFPNDLTISSPITFQNSVGVARANGLVVVVGDLRINGDLMYEDQNEADLKHFASVGWLVLKRPDGTGGNVIIDGGVRTVSGVFYAEGTISTGASDEPFDAYGAFIANAFELQRTFSSRVRGAERIQFDPRGYLNPPPGFSDMTRSLPGFRSVPGE